MESRDHFSKTSGSGRVLGSSSGFGPVHRGVGRDGTYLPGPGTVNEEEDPRFDPGSPDRETSLQEG